MKLPLVKKTNMDAIVTTEKKAAVTKTPSEERSRKDIFFRLAEIPLINITDFLMH